MGEAAGVVVQVLHMDAQSPVTQQPHWDGPRIVIRRMAGDQVADVLLPAREAAPLAAIFRALGQASLGALLAEAAALAQKEYRS